MSIEDEVLRTARIRAMAEGRTLSALVTEALRERLGRGRAPDRVPFEAVTSRGGRLREGVDLTDNAAVRDLMDEE